MPEDPQPPERDPLDQVVDDVGIYPRDAYIFLHDGLEFTVKKLRGAAEGSVDRPVERHVTGQELCQGLRELALQNWGLMARAVLNRWNITSTRDFGRMVYSLIEAGLMRKTDADSLDDFNDVYDFATAFDTGYRIEKQK